MITHEEFIRNLEAHNFNGDNQAIIKRYVAQLQAEIRNLSDPNPEIEKLEGQVVEYRRAIHASEQELYDSQQELKALKAKANETLAAHEEEVLNLHAVYKDRLKVMEQRLTREIEDLKEELEGNWLDPKEEAPSSLDTCLAWNTKSRLCKVSVFRENAWKDAWTGENLGWAPEKYMIMPKP